MWTEAIVLPTLFMLLALALFILADRTCRQRIEEELRKEGATDVKLSHAWLVSGRYTFTYNVTYTLRGRRRQKRCCFCQAKLDPFDGRIWTHLEAGWPAVMIESGPI